MISALAMACGGGDEAPTPTPADADTATASASPSDTPSATSTRTNTATPTNTSTPTATPTPFDGTVARLSIPKFGIDYPIEPLGLIAGANQLDTPHDETGEIGWYHIYPKPGFGQNSVYSAHVNYNGAAGPFDRLNEARIGDEIFVQMEGGPQYKFIVFHAERFVIDPAYATATMKVIDMGALAEAPLRPAGEEWITLITCSCEPGRIINQNEQGFGECVDRDVVFARRVE
jgi:sortase (surface protein transpeptidase)